MSAPKIELCGEGDIIIYSNGGEVLRYVGSHVTADQRTYADENTRRLIASWNRCRHMTVEEIKLETT